MLNFILEIIITVLFAVTLVFNIIDGSWFFVTLDAIIVIMGIVNSVLAYKVYKRKRKKNNGGNE
jgi:membrane protein YdbS with pleckstrin-like domain